MVKDHAILLNCKPPTFYLVLGAYLNWKAEVIKVLPSNLQPFFSPLQRNYNTHMQPTEGSGRREQQLVLPPVRDKVGGRNTNTESPGTTRETFKSLNLK